MSYVLRDSFEPTGVLLRKASALIGLYLYMRDSTANATAI
uniref:Uncharacterized protein n=1 Tax=Anguilla anguilla TaxID=7936 RepID=A0A0E9UPG3_ANGAN